MKPIDFLRLDVKDYLGISIVAAAIGLLFLHKGDVHSDATQPTQDGEIVGAATMETGGVVGTASTEPDHPVTVFSNVTVADRQSRQIVEHQVVMVRDGQIEWIGPSDEAAIPPGARVVQGDGTQFLLSADPSARLFGHGLRAGDPADLVMVSEDPDATPEVLEKPLCVMRQGVVVSISPSLLVAD
ncbi:MAG: hypothetical protein L7S64_09360 [Longimicrobiales bacterium]|nr:hypothetical protein [Longimicrobiales bacterium]